MPLDRGIFESDVPKPTVAAPRVHDLRELFILRLGRLLHAHGTPTDRLEADLAQLAARLGIPGQFLSTPTGLQVAFGELTDQRVHLLRVEPGEAALGKLCDLGEVARLVDGVGLDPAAGLAALQQIDDAPPRFGRGAVIVAFGVAAAGAARLFGGGSTEVILSFFLAAFVASLPRLIPSHRNPIGLFEPLAAFLVALFAALVARVTSVQASIVTLASLIVLLPGLTLTLAFAELATRHLVSGTARLFGAATTFLGLGLGLALAHALATNFLPDALPVRVDELPTWTLFFAIAVCPPAFAILFQARIKELPWIATAGLLGLAGNWLGKLAVGATLSGFVGALAVGLVGELYARRTRGPALVATLPGLLMLVPGSIGLESLTLFLAEDAQHGIEAAFRTAMSALALVGGVLTARAVLPPRP